MLPSEVEDIGASDYDLLARYWYEEPWGAYRDNVHAAIVAREIRSANYKGAHALKDFLLKSPERRADESRSSLFNLFRGMVKRKNRR